MKLRLLLFMFTLLAGWTLLTLAQDEAEILDVSGEWVGVMAWHYENEISGEPGTLQIYRINILQDGSRLRATHLTDGEKDVLYTQPADRYDDLMPDRFGFDGLLQGATLHFDGIGIFLGHCLINIRLHYGEIEGEAVLVGEWERYIPPLPTQDPAYTPDPNAPDMVVGCGTPPGGPIVLRRFGDTRLRDTN